MKEVLKNANIPIPMLSPAHHGICNSSPEHPEQQRICAAYKEQVINYYIFILICKERKEIKNQTEIKSRNLHALY